MREPNTADENIVYHGWVDALYRKYRAWLRLSFHNSDQDADQREYRESIGAVKAFRSILETLFNWPSEDLDDAGDKIYARVRTELAARSRYLHRTADQSTDKRIAPEKGRIYSLHSGGSYICVDVLQDETPAGAVLRRLSDGYVLRAHGLWLAPDGTVHWDYSTGGHWPEGKIKPRMSIGEAVTNLKKYQGYEQIDEQTGCRKHAFDLNDETVDTLLAAMELLDTYISGNAPLAKGLR